MSVLAAFAAAAEEGQHALNELPMPPLAYGLIAFGIFTALAIVTFSFRDVANRHAAKAAAFASERGDDQQH